MVLSTVGIGEQVIISRDYRYNCSHCPALNYVCSVSHGISGFCNQAPVQPGSMDNESGIFAMNYDQSGSRLITCEADKTIKIYKEDDTAVSLSYYRYLNLLGIVCIVKLMLFFRLKKLIL